MKKVLFFASVLSLAAFFALQPVNAMAQSPVAGHSENHICKGAVCLGGLLQGPKMGGSELATGYGGLNCNEPGSHGANVNPNSFFRMCGYVCCSIPCAPPYCWSSGATAACREGLLRSQCTAPEGACEDDPEAPCKSAANPGEGYHDWPHHIAISSCLGYTQCEMNWTGRTGTGHTGWGCPDLDMDEGCIQDPNDFPPHTPCPEPAEGTSCSDGIESGRDPGPGIPRQSPWKPLPLP